MSTLSCPNGCNSGWIRARQMVKKGRAIQEATCAGCNTVVRSEGGVVMDHVEDMTQDK